MDWNKEIIKHTPPPKECKKIVGGTVSMMFGEIILVLSIYEITSIRSINIIIFD